MTDKPLVGGDAAGNVQGPVSRRALVAGLAGALGATVATTVGTAAPAEAASPPVLLSQDNTGPNAHRTAIFVPNNTEVASLVLATAQNNRGVYVVAAVPDTNTSTVVLILNNAAGTASAPPDRRRGLVRGELTYLRNRRALTGADPVAQAINRCWPRRRPVSILRSAVLPATDGTNGVRSTR